MSPDPDRVATWLPALQSMAAEAPLTLRVRGECMWPLAGDAMWIQVAGPARRYWPGDVVVALIDGPGLVLHRVIGAYPRGGQWKYLTQGDRSPRPDLAIPPARILGRVSGGECSPLLIAVPLRHRLRALRRGIHFAARRLLGR